MKNTPVLYVNSCLTFSHNKYFVNQPDATLRRASLGLHITYMPKIQMHRSWWLQATT